MRLAEQLVEMLRAKIADPEKRHFGGDKVYHGSSSDPGAVDQFLRGGAFDPGESTSAAWDSVMRQMTAWGQQLPEMRLASDAHGNRSASTESPRLPLAPPATDEEIARLENRIARPLPEDLRQMFCIANGGWGPGYSYTVGHGPGILSTDGVIAELDDLERRGPGYTGEMAWPANLLPLTDLGGTVSYDLETGEIVQWDDHWYDHDKKITQAFAVSHPSLQDFLQEWLLD